MKAGKGFWNELGKISMNSLGQLFGSVSETFLFLEGTSFSLKSSSSAASLDILSCSSFLFFFLLKASSSTKGISSSESSEYWLTMDPSSGSNSPQGSPSCAFPAEPPQTSDPATFLAPGLLMRQTWPEQDHPYRHHSASQD